MIELSPLRAWARPLLQAHGLPLVVFAFLTSTSLPYCGWLSFWWLAVGLYALVVHLLSYVIIGIPFYFLCWGRCPLLWTPIIGIPLGIFFGIVSFSNSLWVRAGMLPSETLFPSAFVLYIGGFYGLVTSWAFVAMLGKEARYV